MLRQRRYRFQLKSKRPNRTHPGFATLCDGYHRLTFAQLKEGSKKKENSPAFLWRGNALVRVVTSTYRRKEKRFKNFRWMQQKPWNFLPVRLFWPIWWKLSQPCSRANVITASNHGENVIRCLRSGLRLRVWTSVNWPKASFPFSCAKTQWCQLILLQQKTRSRSGDSKIK